MDSGGECSSSVVDGPVFEEAPPTFISVVWRYFGFSIKYDNQGARCVNKKYTDLPHLYAVNIQHVTV